MNFVLNHWSNFEKNLDEFDNAKKILGSFSEIPLEIIDENKNIISEITSAIEILKKKS